MQQEYSFTVVLEPAEEGGFLVFVPALPEVNTYGDTEEEALAAAEDAIRLVIGYRRDNGEPIPRETEPLIQRIRVAVPS